ncbi:MAG: glycoside hydrolase family 3 C-terminal domain-containing protein [Bacteroidetes bacterium]|nr:glycoside hydrolase family 3 C-terminal domain-containing protein [Bacteroidota bacterium]
MKTILTLSIVLAAFLTAGPPPVDRSSALERRVDSLLKLLTLEEKLDLLSGTGFDSKPVPRLGIPALSMTDGPVGVRWNASVAFPASIMLAATFDTALAQAYGKALALETKAKGRNTILGPCVNINRVPHGGRNFESFGEDPFLTSRLAVGYVKGVQSEGVVATTKHFAVNNQETDRMTVDAIVDKRALYEIYFPAFKAAVQEAKTEAIMCAYNKLNGPYCSENEMLLNTVLKEEWKFDGLVMSDWGAVHSTLGAATYGLDLEMPGGEFLTKEKLFPLVQMGKVPTATIDDKVRRLLRVIVRMGYMDGPLEKPVTNAPEHRAVALDVARKGIVLLRNEGKILPLDPAGTRSIAVIGPNAEVLRTGGGGSSMVEPAFTESPLAGVRRTFPGATVRFAPGARQMGDVPPIDAKYLFLPGDSLGVNGLSAEYFNNMDLSGSPALRRTDKTIAFHWGGEGPAEGFGKDKFSVRWTGTLRPDRSGTFELTTASDDGIRLWLDGKLLIDFWSDHGVDVRTASVALQAGRSYSLKVEYYENGGDAVAKVGWVTPDEDILRAAVDAARSCERVLLFLGHSHHQESEGFDRRSLDLPEDQLKLIDAVTAVNPNTVVILTAGAQVNVAPWLGSVKGLLWAFFPGQEGTQALMDVLTGTVNPSGKLPFTIAKQWEDYPAFGNFPGSDGAVTYAEGLMVGYRHFDTRKVAPMFPFGYGLSYSTFSLSDLTVRPLKNGGVEVKVTVKNTGTLQGTEVVQLYVHDRKPKLERPHKELKAFTRVELQAGEKRTVTLRLDDAAFRYYDAEKGTWVRSSGGYIVYAGSSSGDVPLQVLLK